MTIDTRKLFESLHKEYYPMVLRLCLGFVKGDHDLSKDLTQEVFINTWKALDKFQGASTNKTWIYRITVNTCLKYIRDKKSKQHVSIETVSQATEECAATNESDYRSLYRAIGQLNEVDSLIIMMVLDDMQYEEIASVVGISAVNLRVKIHRIKKDLKKLIGNGQFI